MSLTDTTPAGGWAFTPEVTAEFDEHVAASVPHYGEIQTMIAELSDWLAPDRAVIADLGASTGTTVAAIADRHPGRTLEAHLYDVETHMLDAARAKLGERPNVRGSYHSTNIVRELRHRGADLTVACLTLQFLPAARRAEALALARAHSAESGAIVVVEKVTQATAEWQEIATELTQERKAAAGLTDKEIRDKQAAIRGVLRPQTVDRLVAELETAGWESVEVLYRWHNWVMLAAKAAPRLR